MQNLYEKILEKWFYSNNEKVVRLNDIKEIFETAKASVPAETLVSFAEPERWDNYLQFNEFATKEHVIGFVKQNFQCRPLVNMQK